MSDRPTAEEMLARRKREAAEALERARQRKAADKPLSVPEASRPKAPFNRASTKRQLTTVSRQLSLGGSTTLKKETRVKVRIRKKEKIKRQISLKKEDNKYKLNKEFNKNRSMER